MPTPNCSSGRETPRSYFTLGYPSSTGIPVLRVKDQPIHGHYHSSWCMKMTLFMSYLSWVFNEYQNNFHRTPYYCNTSPEEVFVLDKQWISMSSEPSSKSLLLYDKQSPHRGLSQFLCSFSCKIVKDIWRKILHPADADRTHSEKWSNLTLMWDLLTLERFYSTVTLKNYAGNIPNVKFNND